MASMVSEQNYRPRTGLSNPRDNPEDWLSAPQTVTRAEKGGRHRASREDLVRRAAAGHLRTWAPSYVVGETTWVNVELPALFWADFGTRAEQNWATGKFAFTVRKKFLVSAFGVVFHRGDLRDVFPKVFGVPPVQRTPTPQLSARQPAAVVSPPSKGGRKMSASWPDWVAELVAYVHENGIPEGQGAAGVDVVLKAVADRLAYRGLEGPARSTAQDAVRAVLLRLRGAGN